jgi:ATP-dependent RNA helicase DDX35
MAFWKPGAARPEPLSLEVDRGAEGGRLVTYNRDENLALAAQRSRLPIFKCRDAILFLVETRATTVLVGQTGCGKTTQVPQYLAEAGWCAGGRMVACTQPRRVAAQTIAARVAEEMGTPLGRDVGYAVRFESVCTPGVTKIVFCTDGVLLRELMDDPLLTKYGVVMVDEAHERSLASDALLGLLKKIQRRRPDLRVVIASATIQAETFAEFFDTRDVPLKPALGPAALAPGARVPSREPGIVSVEGRAHSVAIHYLAKPGARVRQSRRRDRAGRAPKRGPGGRACVPHRRGRDRGGVRDAARFCGKRRLKRLPGDERAARPNALPGTTNERERTRGEPSNASSGIRSRLVVCPLYAGLPPAAQTEAFAPAPRYARKVVVASNVAETSVTIEGVAYVIDCLFAKKKSYDASRGAESLLVAPVSRAAANQRAGRAGRLRPGKCFRLCTELDFGRLPEQETPEMLRSDLASLVLQLKHLGIDNIVHFEWLSPPPAANMLKAIELLYALGALDDDAKLTSPLGVRLAELPLEPQLGKALLVSDDMGCVSEMLTVAAFTQVTSVWQSSRGRQKALDEARDRFAVAEGDAVTFLNVFNAWERAGGVDGGGKSRAFAEKNMLSRRALVRASDIREQLSKHVSRFGLNPSRSDRAGKRPRPGAPRDGERLLRQRRDARAARGRRGRVLFSERSGRWHVVRAPRERVVPRQARVRGVRLRGKHREGVHARRDVGGPGVAAGAGAALLREAQQERRRAAAGRRVRVLALGIGV